MAKRPSAGLRDILYRFHRELDKPYVRIEDQFREVLSLTCQRARADRASVFRAVEGQEEFRLGVCLDRGRFVELEEALRAGENSPLRALLAGRTRHLGHASPHPILFVPLRSEQEPRGEGGFGFLRLERLRGRRPFSLGERETAAFLAMEAARSLHQTRIALARQEQVERLETMTDLTAVFANSLRMEDGLKLILHGIVRHFELDRVRLYLLDRGAQCLRGELGVDIRGKAVGLRSEEVPIGSGQHRLAKALRGEVLDPLMKRYEERILYLPLAVQGQKTGLLVADNLFSQRAIEGMDIGLLRSFADQIALAVDNARLFEEVQALSLYDGLTGLPVRRFFMQRLQEELYRAERFGQPLALALLDVDYFKGVNDTYGHQIGDRVLKEIGAVILRNLRKIDFPARYGGDEILILLPQSKEEDAGVIMGRLVQEIRSLDIPVEFAKTGKIRVTASIGFAACPQDGRTAEELMRRADEALYWVKSRGRDGVAAYRHIPKAVEAGMKGES